MKRSKLVTKAVASIIALTMLVPTMAMAAPGKSEITYINNSVVSSYNVGATTEQELRNSIKFKDKYNWCDANVIGMKTKVYDFYTGEIGSWEQIPDTEYNKDTKTYEYRKTENAIETGYTDWALVDKETYDKETNSDLKKMTNSDRTDWITVSESKYNEYPAEDRRVIPGSKTTEVDANTYNTTPDEFKGGVIWDTEWTKTDYTTYANWDPNYRREDGTSKYVVAIAEVYTSNCHNPGSVVANTVGGSGLIDGGSTQLNPGDTISTIAEALANKFNATVIDDFKVAYNGYWLPGYEQFSSNGKTDGLCNETVYEDLHPGVVYPALYYTGTDDIQVCGYFGIILAPNAKVTVSGKNVGLIVAKEVSDNGESCKTQIYSAKGDCSYYIKYPHYFVKERVFQVRDIVEKFYTRTKTFGPKYERAPKKYVSGYCNWIPDTGIFTNGYLLAVILLLVFGSVLFFIPKKKETK